jgi:hypothetical protein
MVRFPSLPTISGTSFHPIFLNTLILYVYNTPTTYLITEHVDYRHYLNGTARLKKPSTTVPLYADYNIPYIILFAS